MNWRHPVFATPIDVVLILVQERPQLVVIAFARCLEEQDAGTCTCSVQAVVDAAITMQAAQMRWGEGGGLTGWEREQ